MSVWIREMQALSWGHRFGAEQTGSTGVLSRIRSWLWGHHTGKLLKQSPRGPLTEHHHFHGCILTVDLCYEGFCVWYMLFILCVLLKLPHEISPVVEEEGLNRFKRCGHHIRRKQEAVVCVPCVHKFYELEICHYLHHTFLLCQQTLCIFTQ